MPFFKATLGPLAHAPVDACDAFVSGEMTFRAETTEDAHQSMRAITDFLAPGMLWFRVEGPLAEAPPGGSPGLPRPSRAVSADELEHGVLTDLTPAEVDAFLEAVRPTDVGPAVGADQCEASSWRGKGHKPYGPQGFNRCELRAIHQTDPEGTPHRDGFGNEFVLEPKFKIVNVNRPRSRDAKKY